MTLRPPGATVGPQPFTEASFAEFVVRAWEDPALAALYQEAPSDALALLGIACPDGVPPLLPAAPVDDLTIEDLAGIRGSAPLDLVTCATWCGVAPATARVAADASGAHR